VHIRCTDPPGKPGRPEVVDWDKDRAEIKWSPPKNDGGSPLTKYVVEKKMKGGMWEKVRQSSGLVDRFICNVQCSRV